MEDNQAIETIRALADGVNPITGELFPDDSVYQHAKVARALLTALDALERRAELIKRRAALPPQTGKPWSTAEEHEMTSLFDQGRSFRQIASVLGRTSGGVAARLAKLGKIELEQQPRFRLTPSRSGSSPTQL